MHRRHNTFDSSLVLKAAGLVAASAASPLVLNVGEGFVSGEVVFDVTALEIASNDESYDLVVQGSTDADFGTAANIVELGAIHLGAKETKRSDSDRDDETGQRILPITNSPDGFTIFPYLRVFTVVAGTIATGINYSAWIRVTA